MTKFNSHKWIREFKSGTNAIAESPASDSTLKSLRIRVRGEEFPDLKVWWEYEPEDIMAYVYWHQKEAGQSTNPVKPFTLGATWSSNFDYAGMLKAGVNAPEALFENIDHLNLLYESFTDVNYHREAKDLGNAIDWLQDANGEEDIAKAEGFLFRFRAACAKTLKDITRGK